MADLSDVENALVALMTSAVYPNGTAAPSIAGVPVYVHRGWPNAETLDRHLAAGAVTISEFPVNGMSRNTTRYPQIWSSPILPANSLTVSVSGNAVTIGGTPASGILVGVAFGDQAAVYAVQASDTPASIAYALVPNFVGAYSQGPAIYLPTTLDVYARTGVRGTAYMETRRQEQAFQLTVWAPTPALRDASAGGLDAAISSVQLLVMPDNTAAHLVYRGTQVFDVVKKDNAWRRDLNYFAEYGTTQSLITAQMLFGDLYENGTLNLVSH